jgi:hypothetical protein
MTCSLTLKGQIQCVISTFPFSLRAAQAKQKKKFMNEGSDDIRRGRWANRRKLHCFSVRGLSWNGGIKRWECRSRRCEPEQAGSYFRVRCGEFGQRWDSSYQNSLEWLGRIAQYRPQYWGWPPTLPWAPLKSDTSLSVWISYDANCGTDFSQRQNFL